MFSDTPYGSQHRHSPHYRVLPPNPTKPNQLLYYHTKHDSRSINMLYYGPNIKSRTHKTHARIPRIQINTNDIFLTELQTNPTSKHVKHIELHI